MPKKKQKSAKNYRYWRQTAAAFAIVALAAAGLAQYQFNRNTERELQANSVFRMRSLIVEALDGLIRLYSEPSKDNRIAETRLQLPAPSGNVDRVLYSYQKGTDGHPDDLQVTTRLLTQLAINKANGTTMDELFGNVPEAQSCTRGFTIRFNDEAGNLPGEDMKFVAAKKLADGRTMHLWRDPLCGANADPNTDSGLRKDAMDALENHLLQAQSY